MQITIPQQNSILKNFENPITFLREFIDLSELQRVCSTKRFLKTIPYFETFKIELFKDLVNDKKNVQELSLKIEEIINLIEKSKKVNSPDISIIISETFDILLKSINILIAKIEMEISTFKYENIRFLFKFTSLNINLYSHFTERILSKKDSLEEEINLILKDIEFINTRSSLCIIPDVELPQIIIENLKIIQGFEMKQIESSEPINSSTILNKYVIYSQKLDLKKVNLDSIIDKNRILKYNLEIIINNACSSITQQNYSSSEDAYIKIMDFSGEISKFISKYPGIEASIETLKEYARFLLVDNVNK